MGEIGGLSQYQCGQGMTDADILKVINPPASERDRSALVAKGSTSMPGHAAWRMSPGIGRKMDKGLKVNHFLINTTAIPGTIYQHHVHIYKVEKDGSIDKKDISTLEDSRITASLMLKLRKRHPEWENISGQPLGFTYDGKNNLHTSAKLPFKDKNERNEPCVTEMIGLENKDGTESAFRRFQLVVTETLPVHAPMKLEEYTDLNKEMIRALDTSLFAFARWQQVQDAPDWHVIGSKIFSSMTESFPLVGAYIAKRGYYASLKSCMAGLVLVSDMSVNCFLASGDMPEVMWKAGGFRSFAEFENTCRTGLREDVVNKINRVIKNAKIRLNHINHWRKARELGPPADSPKSTFDCDGKQMTVAQYFEKMGADKQKPEYNKALKGGRLRYPKLPCINIGTLQRPVLIPPELLSVAGGQTRSQAMTGEMTAQMIRIAAVRPQERMEYIIDGDKNNGAGGESIVNILQKDPNARAFGIHNMQGSPMEVPAVFLPQAKLRYKGEAVVDPGFAGSWNIDRPQMKFVTAPPNPNKGGGYGYGVLLVGDGPPREMNTLLATFVSALERDAKGTGCPISPLGPPLTCRDSNVDLTDKFKKFKVGGARIVVVLMVTDSYGSIKYVSDRMGIPTQCVRWKNVDRPPRGFHLNLMMKINTKLGGTNHTLATRLPRPAPNPMLFQDPPASFSWLFDKPCMLVGIDVSHAEPGSDRPSTAAVVASMDGRASQYVAHLSSQANRVEMVSALEEAMMSLLNSFKERNNGKMPANIIVYRDGVSDGQFDQVLTDELPMIKGALELMGYHADQVKVAVIICQKGHHTRIVYEEKTSEGTSFINPCPGLLLDATGGNKSVTNSRINEFYLNSHVAIQGTAKPCKYALIYDEIGFKLSEIELLTYWTTYLYARCNKSVSYATPAYYAHWASKRAKDLLAAGASSEDLLEISALWGKTAGGASTMFFV